MADFIFDLDYTLFDTEALKTGLAEALGLSREDFLESYRQNFKNRKVSYDPETHLKILGKEKDAALKKRLKGFFDGLDRYLYSGAKELLHRLKSGNRLIMITYGNKEWQKLKFNSLAIKEFFDEVHYVEGDKDKELAGLFKKDGSEKVIINDNAKEGFEMEKSLENSRLYLVNGPYSRNVEHEQEIFTLAGLYKEFFPEKDERANEFRRQALVK